MTLAKLTLIAVLVHLGTSLAASLLKSKTDQEKIAAINAMTDHIVGVLSQVAPALPTTRPKTLSDLAGDVATAAQALAAATAPPLAPTQTISVPVVAPPVTFQTADGQTVGGAA